LSTIQTNPNTTNASSQHPTPNTRHSPSSQHPTPNTRRSPSSLHPTPYPLHPKSVFHLRARLEENFRRVEKILKRIESDDGNPTAQIAAAAELRQHIALADKALETILKTEAMKQLEEIVIESLRAANVKVRRKALDILNERANQPNAP
jgi:hypothetical protein